MPEEKEIFFVIIQFRSIQKIKREYVDDRKHRSLNVASHPEHSWMLLDFRLLLQMSIESLGKYHLDVLLDERLLSFVRDLWH